MRCVRTGRYKYIRSFEPSGREVLPNIESGPTKRLQYEAGIYALPRAPEMLYDLLYDPQEFHNLAADESYHDVREDLAGRLARWMQETHDPLRHGPVPLPEGARVTPREQYDPQLPGE